ncbi:MAG: phosphohydrolase [Treponema sp.]|nr:phosphohydrolase [Treponema sp.]
MRSPKEVSLDTKIIEAAQRLAPDSAAVALAKLLSVDDEIQGLQEYANNVSIKRLGYNDHGPVHMRTVALNSVILMELLRKAGIPTSLEKEEYGTFDDSLAAVLLAASLHDLGMSIGRQDHELHSAYLSYPIMDRLLAKTIGNTAKRVMIRSLALEGISGHMGNRQIYSLEAGVILVADGCDMEKGRARIPMAISSVPKMGDIHKISANSIEDVRIGAGKQKPICIEVHMSGEVGLFQIEEVLLGKISVSTIREYIELYAIVNSGEGRQYL